MIRAVIFDFDGVIADTEPIHYEAFRKVLLNFGLVLDKGSYYSDYLAYDDLTFFRTFLKDNKIEADREFVDTLMHKKSVVTNKMLQADLRLFPGAGDLIRECSKRFSIAIGSGALKQEIEIILKKFGLLNHFEIIVSAEDVGKCKPDPEVYMKVLSRLNGSKGVSKELSAGHCVVIEDSVHGVTAAKSAGMRCVAVTNSFPEEDLKEADVVVSTLEDFDLRLFESFSIL